MPRMPQCVPPSPSDFVESLPARNAAVSVLAYAHETRDPRAPHRIVAREQRLLALCVRRDGFLTVVPLGSLADIEALVARIRGTGDTTADQRELRRLVIDPIRAALSDIGTIWLSLDASLLLVPLDALPEDDGTLVGAHVELRTVGSLQDLQRGPREPEAGDLRLLALGGIDYDSTGDAVATTVPDAAAPLLANAVGKGQRGFAPLPQGESEALDVARLFATEHPHDEAVVRSGAAATAAALFAEAPRATFLHLATHGYVEREWVRSAEEPSIDRGAEDRDARTPIGLLPLSACGVALAGANRPPDALGRRPGVVTGEELMHLDLSHCELVFLSAFDTSGSGRRATRRCASLRAAVLGAGARCMVTPLWKTDGAATCELVTDFYRRLWIEHEKPVDALWGARMALRARGAPFRDWAGWVLVGL